MSTYSIIATAILPIFVSSYAYGVLIVICIVILIMMYMRPRRFYFVRHGETILNAAHIKQGAEGGLSDKGKQQAAMVGTSLAPVGIDKIISSPYERAKETSLIINEQMHVPIVYSELFAERRNPSEVLGKNRDEPEVVRIIDEMDLAYHTDDYRFSDEESFLDLKERGRKCLAFLARQNGPEVAVITHHAFLKMIIAYMLYRERLHAPDFVKLSFFNVSDNAGITVCEYHPWKMFSETRGWEVVTYNAQAG